VKSFIVVAANLVFGITSAVAANHVVQIGDDCFVAPACFTPPLLTIDRGDTVTFQIYADTAIAEHNVVADDRSFRCALGCDGEGGDGTPRNHLSRWSFIRTFSTPGTFAYHDEVSRAAGVLVVRGPQGFAIGPGTTGAWFDPAQSGHGLVIEVLPGQRLYASWFAFNPGGTEQAWFSGVGTYAGGGAEISLMQIPSGGRWIPGFDPSLVVRKPWGQLIFTFQDCDHGRVSFNAVAGYGAGTMELTRLTRPAGLNCEGQQ
jgi:plastocyanin